MRSTQELRGIRVRGGKRWVHRIGKVRHAVFYPDGQTLAGYLVKRMDFLLMFKRKDRFFAADSFQIQDGRIIVDSTKDSWDKAACKRLGLDWDQSILLEGLIVFSSAGNKLGRVEGIVYDEQTRVAQEFLLSTGVATKTLLGFSRVPLSAVRRRNADSIIVEEGFRLPEAQGGLAGKAGERAAVISNTVSTTAHNVGEKAGRTVNKLAFQTGKQIGRMKQRSAESAREVAAEAKKSGRKPNQGVVNSGVKAVGRQLGRSRGMFKSFGDEYRKAAGNSAKKTKGDSKPGAKKTAGTKAAGTKAVSSGAASSKAVSSGAASSGAKKAGTPGKPARAKAVGAKSVGTKPAVKTKSATAKPAATAKPTA
ncbi:MAG: hypothetical protein FWF30_03830, partial [Coriobacteriia bacterium]|nr:hypothetical protein [Coriobacteriia bacterium]